MIGVIVENWVVFDIAKDTPTKWRGAHMIIKSYDYDDFDHYHHDFYRTQVTLGSDLWV